MSVAINVPVQEELDVAVRDLNEKKRRWAGTSVEERLADIADGWAETASRRKLIPEGSPLEDVQSGIGFVHNSYMFEKVERTVIEAPFRPFPRNLLHGGMTLLPRPPWFVTNKKADILGKLLTQFQHRPSFLKIPRIFLNALLG